MHHVSSCQGRGTLSPLSYMHHVSSCQGNFKVELLTLVKSVMFPCVVSHLFGNDILPEGKVCHDVSTDHVTTVSTTCRNQCLNFRNVSSNMIKILSMEQNYQKYL